MEYNGRHKIVPQPRQFSQQKESTGERLLRPSEEPTRFKGIRRYLIWILLGLGNWADIQRQRN